MNMKHMNRRDFCRATAFAVGGLALGARAKEEPMEAPPGTPRWDGMPEIAATLKVAKADRAKLMQLTDLHFFGAPYLPARDKKTMEDLPRLVDSLDPDLLVVTGDLWHDNPDGRGAEFMEGAVANIEALGRPWVFTWGNHDQVDDYAKGHERITKAKGSLYRGGPGGGNYVVSLCDASGKPGWSVLCLNSNDAGLGAAQHAWIKEHGAGLLGTLPAFVAAHIPLKQQAEAWEAKQAAGIRLEAVTHEHEDGSSLTAIKGACAARAFFCGHDHVNDYSAVVDGVELVYGHSTGWAGYGSNEMPKGAKLITANLESGSYAWETVLMDGARWKPEAGKAIDKVLDTPWDVPAKSSQRAKDEAVK